MVANLSAQQLRRAAMIKDQIDALHTELNRLFTSPNLPTSTSKRSMSPAARRKIAAAQKARWAKAKGTEGKLKKQTGRKMSATARARIAAAAKARWAKAKASGKNSL
jgi:hypothetical protein